MKPVIEELLPSRALQRIGGIDMNCGMNYTSAPLFRQMLPYSRLQHSISTACIIARFSDDARQAAAGLFHDIATPVFSHVIDFLNGDYERQESTENGTEEMIREDPLISDVLQRHGISVGEVSDYHLYPIADNDTPHLSADRLEYSLSNMVNYGFADVETAIAFYDDLVLAENEEGEEEIAFSSPHAAALFTRHVLQCSRVYSSDLDRYGMEILSELVNGALQRGAVEWKDLYTNEESFIRKLQKDPASALAWQHFRRLKSVRTCQPGTPGSRVIPGKKRYIDPLVKGRGRISMIDVDTGELIRQYVSETFDHAVTEDNGGKQ